VFIHKTNSTGDSLLTKVYVCGYSSDALFIQKWRNEFILGGYKQDTLQNLILSPDGLILFLDSMLDSISTYYFDTGMNESFYSSVAISSNFIVAGGIMNSSQTIGDVCVLKFDTNNTFLNSKIISGPAAEYYYAGISTTSDNGLIIGTSSYNSLGYPSALLIKTNINGDLLPVEALKINHLTSVNPNPSKGLFHFRFDKPIQAGMVYNLQGDVQCRFLNNEIDLSDFVDGIYFYKVTLQSGQMESGKLIKIQE
jgi:hypothetical protein